MNYIPGHSFFLRSIDSAATISDTTGAVSNAPAISSAADVGYTEPGAMNVPENTQHGFAGGSVDPLYDKKGWVEPNLSADIRLGSVAYIATKLVPANGVPVRQDLFFGNSGVFARALYRAMPASVSLAFPMSESAELTASARFEAEAYAAVSPITLGYEYEEFGPALLSTDVRSAAIGETDIIKNLMALSLDIDYQIERKNGRRNLGDNVPGTLTSYDIITHHRTVSGSIQLHDLPSIESTLFYGSATAKKWSDIVITVNDIAEESIYDLVIHNPRPVARSQNAIQSAGQMNWTVPFIASGVTITTSRESGGDDE